MNDSDAAMKLWMDVSNAVSGARDRKSQKTSGTYFISHSAENGVLQPSVRIANLRLPKSDVH